MCQCVRKQEYIALPDMIVHCNKKRYISVYVRTFPQGCYIMDHIERKSEFSNIFENRLDELWHNEDLLTYYRSIIDHDQ